MSRIREQYDLTGDNTAAVATGLQRTGGIITSAALLLLVVIGASRCRDHVHQADRRRDADRDRHRRDDRPDPAGAGHHAAARPGQLVAPGPLRRLYARYGIRESDGEPAAERAPELAGAR